MFNPSFQGGPFIGGLTVPRSGLIWYAPNGVDIIQLSAAALWAALPTTHRSIYLVDENTLRSAEDIIVNIQASTLLNDGGTLVGSSTRGYAQYNSTTSQATLTRAYLVFDEYFQIALDKILATTANLVDVFIYNTLEDSDDGVWVNNATTQSWYTEALNTATRGSKRGFPKLPLIVVETTKVTLYDATEANAPMWRVYDFTGYTIRAAWMLNGVLCVATSTGLYKYNHLTASSFFYTTSSSPSIVNNSCNDVAMTTISRTENSFGLLDPVIAVATDGGVSVIDGPAGVGTVVDITRASGFSRVSLNYSRLWAIHGTDSYISVGELPVADSTHLSWRSTFYSGAGDSIPSLRGGSYVSATIEEGLAGSLGVSKLSEDTTTPANGMVAYITNSYNTGWMKGDIRRALICDAEGTTETLTNLVTNGTFDSDTVWDKGTGWTISGGVASKVAGVQSYLKQTINIPRPGTYQFVVPATLTAGTLGITYSAGTATLTNTGSNVPISASGTVYRTFTFSSSGTFGLWINADASFEGSVDNVISQELIQDRSVKASSMTVNGSLTRSPVAAGAELQAISGFSASNFLSQAYSADLDFGTGDFYICGWVKSTSTTTAQILHRSNVANTGPFISLYRNSTSLKLTLQTGVPGTNTTHNSDLALTTGVWNFFCVTRKSGGSAEFFLNGLTQTISGTVRTVTATDTSLYVGLLSTGLYPLTDGSIALLRIGAGSLSAAQIAKIYREELALFQPGAKCTIQGASSAVTALAFNERYNKLLVGTSAGVTTFSNLAVEDGFYTNSGSIKAISSNNKINLCASTAEVKVKKA